MSLTAAVPLVIVGLSSSFAADSPTVRVPSRVAEEAAVLQQNAARILTRETLVQRALLPPGPSLRVRAVVSEFSFGPVQSVDAARRARKRMLQQFVRHALVHIATDYSLIVLEMDISSSGRCDIGADPALAFLWKQHSAEGGLTEFHGRESVHRALQGTLWVRAADGLSLRVNAWMEYTGQNDNRIRDSSIVTENLYLYEPFQFFSASSTISFGSPE